MTLEAWPTHRSWPSSWPRSLDTLTKQTCHSRHDTLWKIAQGAWAKRANAGCHCTLLLQEVIVELRPVVLATGNIPCGSSELAGWEGLIELCLRDWECLWECVAQAVWAINLHCWKNWPHISLLFCMLNSSTSCNWASYCFCLFLVPFNQPGSLSIWCNIMRSVQMINLHSSLQKVTSKRMLSFRFTMEVEALTSFSVHVDKQVDCLLDFTRCSQIGQGQVGFALTNSFHRPTWPRTLIAAFLQHIGLQKNVSKNKHLDHLVSGVESRSPCFNSGRRHCLLSWKTTSRTFHNLKPPTRPRSVPNGLAAKMQSLAYVVWSIANSQVLAAQPLENSLPIALNDFQIAFQGASQTWANTRMVDAKVMWSGLGPAPSCKVAKAAWSSSSNHLPPKDAEAQQCQPVVWSAINDCRLVREFPCCSKTHSSNLKQKRTNFSIAKP